MVTDDETKGSNKTPKTTHACIVEPRESVRNLFYHKIMKITSQREREFTSMRHHNLVFVLMPQAMKILDAKAAADSGWEKLEKLVKSKKEVILEA